MEALQALISSNQLIALGVVLGVMTLGDVVSKITGGKVPSGVIIMILLVAGFWTFLPKDLADAAGLGGKVYVLSVSLLITHLGTLISRKQMISQWRTVLISLLGIFFLCLFCLTAGSVLFGRQSALAAAPVLAGGAVASAIMQEAATAAGNTQAALVALVCMTVQGLVGMPVESLAVRKQVKELREKYARGEIRPEAGDAASESRKENKDGTNMILFKIVLCAIAASLITKATNGILSQYVLCLLIGFFASEIGFLPENALGKAHADGFLMFILLGTLFCGFSSASPELIAPVLVAVIGLLAIATAGLALAAWISSRVFHRDESFFSALGVTINAFLGFPLNVMVVNEVLNEIDDPEERKVISGIVTPKVLVAGFVCVTIVSVVIAGIFKGMM